MDVDILCIQEHKIHDNAGCVQLCNGYTLILGGITGQYSSTLTFIKNSLNPSLGNNHDSSRCLGIQVVSSFGPICVLNVYAFNSVGPCAQLWD